MKFQSILVIFFSYAVSGMVMAGSLTIPKTFVTGETARASEVNDNFSAIKTEIDDNDARINQNESAMSFKQERVTESCPAGESIRVINSDGSVSCEVDNNSDTQYSAGSGLMLNGNEFSTDSTVLQNRVSDSCPAGESIRVINSDGSVTCEVDSDTDTDTTYSAGSGLLLNNTEFSVDATVLQNRVTGVCPTGETISSIDENGNVSCHVDANTTYSTGSGLLELNPGEFSADPDVVQFRLSQDCAAGSSIRAINRDGTVECEADTDTDTTYSAGTGMQLNNSNEFSPADGWVSVPSFAFVAKNKSNNKLVSYLTFLMTIDTCVLVHDDSNSYTYFKEPVLPGQSYQVDAKCDAFAPISIPHGATLKSFSCTVYDNDSNNILTAYLMRASLTDGAKTALFQTGGSNDSSSLQQIIDSSVITIQNETPERVDNENYTYNIYVDWSANDFENTNNLSRIYGCAVEYVFQ